MLFFRSAVYFLMLERLFSLLERPSISFSDQNTGGPSSVFTAVWPRTPPSLKSCNYLNDFAMQGSSILLPQNWLLYKSESRNEWDGPLIKHAKEAVEVDEAVHLSHMWKRGLNGRRAALRRAFHNYGYEAKWLPTKERAAHEWQKSNLRARCSCNDTWYCG